MIQPLYLFVINKRIDSHLVAQDIARRSKGSMGWFYGAKCHLAVNDKLQITATLITNGSVYDGHVAPQLVDDESAIITGDGHYNAERLKAYFARWGVRLIARLTHKQKQFHPHSPDNQAILNRRQRVESVFRVLKETLGMVLFLP